jgi:hypothetical protein
VPEKQKFVTLSEVETCRLGQRTGFDSAHPDVYLLCVGFIISFTTFHILFTTIKIAYCILGVKPFIPIQEVL